MTVAYILIWGCMLVFGSSAVCALLWAIRGGQMSNLRSAAASIFDEKEPIGVQTDFFPGARK